MWNIFSRDPLPDFELLDQIEWKLSSRSLWRLRKARRRSTDEFVSVFIGDAQVDRCRETYRRMKTLKHPNILSWLDGKESETQIYIITDYVMPLEKYLTDCDSQCAKDLQEIGYGLTCITTALKFLHEDAKLFHNNVQLGSVYVSISKANWLLGDLDFCFYKTTLNENAALSKLLPANFSTHKEILTDHWGLGCLIWEISNYPYENFSYKSLSRIPSSLVDAYKKLMTSNAATNSYSLTNLLECSFLNCELTKIMKFMSEVQLYTSLERRKMLLFISKVLNDLPVRTVSNGLFPLLVALHELEPSLDAQILEILLPISEKMSNDEFTARMLPVVVNMFSSNDRALRLKLLSNMNKFIGYFTPALVNDDLFVPITRGLLDTHPTLREATLRTLLLIVPLLNHKNLNVQLMRLLAKIQTRDTDDGVRTNTTVLLSHIAPRLDPSLRSELLLAAFTRALHDKFPPARQAGVSGFLMTKDFFSLNDIANKIIPSISPSLIDIEEVVRSETFKLLNELIGILKKVSDNPSLAADMEKNVLKCDVTLANETSWTGWALSSIAQQIRVFQNKKNQASVNLKSSNENSNSVGNNQELNSTKELTHISTDVEWSDALSDTMDNLHVLENANSENELKPLNESVVEIMKEDKVVELLDSSSNSADWNTAWEKANEPMTSSISIDTDDFFNEFLNDNKKSPVSSTKQTRKKSKALKLGAKRVMTQSDN